MFRENLTGQLGSHWYLCDSLFVYQILNSNSNLTLILSSRDWASDIFNVNK